MSTAPEPRACACGATGAHSPRCLIKACAARFRRPPCRHCALHAVNAEDDELAARISTMMSQTPERSLEQSAPKKGPQRG